MSDMSIVAVVVVAVALYLGWMLTYFVSLDEFDVRCVELIENMTQLERAMFSHELEVRNLRALMHRYGIPELDGPARLRETVALTQSLEN